MERSVIGGLVRGDAAPDFASLIQAMAAALVGGKSVIDALKGLGMKIWG